MTPKEFAKEMRQLEKDYKDDPEAKHGRMDDLMCRVLRDLGVYCRGSGV